MSILDPTNMESKFYQVPTSLSTAHRALMRIETSRTKTDGSPWPCRVEVQAGSSPLELINVILITVKSKVLFEC